MLILIAPDKFKESLAASEVAQAIAEGVRRVFPDAGIEIFPLGDGGEGTLEALMAAVGGRIETVEVSGPLGAPVHAPLGRLDDGRIALEVAAASGLTLVPKARRDALGASSRGTGELILAGLDQTEPTAAIVGIGGSASTDGGTGAASAAGWRFLDGRGRTLPSGGGALVNLARIDGSDVDTRLAGCAITGAADIDNPLVGERGAARVFGPQKGASPEQVTLLDDGLSTLADVVNRDLDGDPGLRGAASAGAAGGLGFGLAAFFGAQLASGFSVVAEATGLASAIARADLVITGEGRLDAGSLGGKTPIGVARMAKGAGVACCAVTGDSEVSSEELRADGIEDAASLVDVVGRRRALGDTAAALADTTEVVLRRGRRL
ncbi:MAG: glycerate kinase [Actinomycetota bacterium]|nr:glycerate kinase [Actinomycetota bacterium]